MTNQTRRKSSEFEEWKYSYVVINIFEEDDNAIGFAAIYDDIAHISAHIANQAILNMMK